MLSILFHATTPIVLTAIWKSSKITQFYIFSWRKKICPGTDRHRILSPGVRENTEWARASYAGLASDLAFLINIIPHPKETVSLK